MNRPFQIPARAWIEASGALARLRPRFFASRVCRPTFIVSSGRSGTTLLNQLFDRHPEVANYPSEANELWHPRLYPYTAARIAAPPFWLDGEAFTRASIASRTERDDLRLAARFGAYQWLRRAPVFLNKTVMVTFMLDHVIELFPEARFIHLYRDGRAVAASWVIKDRDKTKHERYRRNGFNFSDDELLERYASHWQAHVLAFEAAARRHRWRERGLVHELSYEQLCADPHRTLASLAEFMGVAPGPLTGLQLGELKNTNYKSKTSVHGPMLERINQVAAEALAAKGYGPEIT